MSDGLEYKESWLEAYFKEHKSLDDYDPHTVFSLLTKLPRNDAKKIAYKNMFQEETPFIIKRLLNSNKEDLECSYKVAKRLSGNTLSKREFYKLMEEES